MQPVPMPQTIDDVIGNLSKLSSGMKYNSFTRMKNNDPFIEAGTTEKYDFLIEYFVDIITGKFNQDVSMLLVGNKGRGKSITALSLSYFAACELAQRMGGHWKDYFDPETNMAVISPKRANEVMAIKDKYAIKNYDDIGIGWGARSWQKKENIEKGDVFQINRIDNQIQLFSVPNQFLLDKIPRSLVSHYAEMDQAFFEFGFSTMKLFKPLTLFREGKIIQPYLSANRVKYVLYRIPKPPEFLIKQYNKIRKDATTEAMLERFKDKEEEVKSERTNKASEKFRPYLPDLLRLHRRCEIFAYLQDKGFTLGKIMYAWQTGVFADMGVTIDSTAGNPRPRER
jgi:hypothetical protein